MKTLTEESDQPSQGPLSGLKKVLIIVPAYNEEKNIIATIEEINGVQLPVEIVVVNDGSSDRTAALVKETGVSLINLPFNLGIGGAVQTGFKFAQQNYFDIAVQIDGDNQHDASYLQALLDPVVKGEVDMTIGSRFLPPYLGYRSSFIRRIGIHFFARLISTLTDYKVTDPTSGFRAFNKKMIDVFADYYPHDFPEPEAIAVAGRHQVRVREVPVKMRKRPSGSSSIRYMYTLYYMIKVTFAILLDKLKSRHGRARND